MSLSIKRISLAWSNVYALIDVTGETTLIDTGLAKDRPRLLSALAEFAVTPQHVRRVLLTHGHCDHAGNAAYFAAQGAEVFAHALEIPFLTLSPRRTYAPPGLRRIARPLSTLLFLAGERLYPVERLSHITPVEDGDLLPFLQGDLRAVHTPGHTPGHLAFYSAEAKTLFSGDAILNIVPIRLKTQLSLPMRVFSEDWPETKRSAQRLATLNPERMFSGHGVPLIKEAATKLDQWVSNLSS